MIDWLMALAQTLVFIVMAPLLLGWIRRVKCHMQNRAAPSLWQSYRDLAKRFLEAKLVALAGAHHRLQHLLALAVLGMGLAREDHLDGPLGVEQDGLEPVEVEGLAKPVAARVMAAALGGLACQPGSGIPADQTSAAPGSVSQNESSV